MLRAAVLALAEHVLLPVETQMRIQSLAERQALADGDLLKVIVGCGLEAQPHSAASR
jgi:hypothetical protein